MVFPTQLKLDIAPSTIGRVRPRSLNGPVIESVLGEILESDLGFQGQATSYASHSIHAFAAKFPPQLPRTFIEKLTLEGELVADPMAGSATALVEAASLKRKAVGVDIDPLAIKIAKAKTQPIDCDEAFVYAEAIADYARSALSAPALFDLPAFYETYSESARKFFQYWFAETTIWELCALLKGIRSVSSLKLRNLFDIIFSSIIVTKSGGVSLARDLAHSRPHVDSSKKVGNAIDAFEEKASKSIKALSELRSDWVERQVLLADCRQLPLIADSVDLIVTSPPYANAIDYVRAHKFSLIWLGYSPESLTENRRKYIGAEKGHDGRDFGSTIAESTINEIEATDKRRAGVVAQYFKDMRDGLKEMLRVLKPGKAAIIVVGSSTIRGVKVRTPFALAEIAENLGFKVVGVQERKLDRDKRLMPVSRDGNGKGIEARMHEEHVIGLVKPYANPS
ncbi:MAG: DNA methyltransferase [Candidatus Binatia bacterium]